MRALNDYHMAVISAHPAARTLLDGTGTDDVARNLHSYETADPYLTEALDLIPADAAWPDDISKDLSTLADRLQLECAADRGASDWADKAITMGWIRTAAAKVWQAEHSNLMTP